MIQKYWLILGLGGVLWLTACQQQPDLPAACDLVSRQYIEDLLGEPVEEGEVLEPNYNAYSACAYPLRVRGRNIQLELYLLPPLPARDQVQVQQMAQQWVSEYGYDGDYDVMPGDYPMVWFSGKIARYPSALLVPFDKATLVIRGLRRDNGQSLAFTAMQQNGWK
jgi:hypothetical protein